MDTHDELHDRSLAELARGLRAGMLDARELTEHFIARIQARPGSHVFISTCFDGARQQAAQSAARWRAGRPLSPWDGIPLAWKDNIDVRGSATTAGAAAFRNAPPATEDSAVAAHARLCGLVTLGKANLSEFAYTALGLNPHFGTPENPRSTDVPRAPGGSSSGSAVAVALGLVPLAIGTDTGGSVRSPAAFNGVVGFKPAVGRYPMQGVFPLSVTLDTVGFFVRHAGDCQAVDAMLRDAVIEEGPQAAEPGLRDLVLVVPENVALDDLEPEVARNFEASIARLAAAGARIVRRPVPQLGELQALVQRHGALASADAYAAHRHLLDGGQLAGMDPFVRRRILAGKAMSAEDVQALREGTRRLQCSLVADLPTGHAIAMPTVPHVAPPLALLRGSEEFFTATNLRTIRNTSLGNLLDLCGLSLPNGSGAAGMPTGISFNAVAGAEPLLLARAAALAAALEG
ncbi:amidase family protein [Ramlibacter sp.]|uniref:amidase family protein n=1 Tax=Ramlibacter sp. TaxID=1917967 RepID=UPI0026332640|nr:amidase family protein [Ramlibacter sp.]